MFHVVNLYYELSPTHTHTLHCQPPGTSNQSQPPAPLQTPLLVPPPQPVGPAVASADAAVPSAGSAVPSATSVALSSSPVALALLHCPPVPPPPPLLPSRVVRRLVSSDWRHPVPWYLTYPASCPFRAADPAQGGPRTSHACPVSTSARHSRRSTMGSVAGYWLGDCACTDEVSSVWVSSWRCGPSRPSLMHRVIHSNDSSTCGDQLCRPPCEPQSLLLQCGRRLKPPGSARGCWPGLEPQHGWRPESRFGLCLGSSVRGIAEIGPAPSTGTPGGRACGE